MQLRQEQKLNLRQEQWMKLQMIQQMKILQLSSLELQDAIQQELVQNPVLEAKEKKDNAVEELGEKEIAAKSETEETASPEDGLVADITESGFGPRLQDSPSRSTAEVIEAVATEGSSLHDYLLEQFSLRSNDFLGSKIGEFLLGNMDGNGYLRTSVKEAAEILQAAEDAVEKVLKVIQGLDPPGIGARDVRECLILQSRILGLDPVKQEFFLQVVKNHLDDLAGGKFNKIAKSLNRNEDEVREINTLIKKLNPYPGQSYSSDSAGRVIPEILISRNNGVFEARIESGRIPRLSFSPLYLKMIKEKEGDTKEYLKKKLESAKLFMRSIEKRQEMIKRLSDLIVSRQKDFLERGIHYLKPLTMEEAAEIAGVHPSTISRAIANKYVQVPKGVFPLKFFFSVPVNKDSRLSSRSIKERIAQLIRAEDTGKPLSDEDIHERLKKEGVEISRRAVAKYRQAMDMPSTFKRRTVKTVDK